MVNTVGSLQKLKNQKSKIKMTMQNSKIWIVVITVVLILSGIFYWFQLRPIQIRKECWSRVEKIKNGEIKSDKFNPNEFAARYGAQKAIDTLYNNCLIEKGL